MLLVVTSVVNFVALAATLWLGWYIVTRSPRRLISWLTSLALWSLMGPFLNILLALTPLPSRPDTPGWLHTFSRFWETYLRVSKAGPGSRPSAAPTAPPDDGSQATGTLRVSNWPLYMADGFVAAFQTATGL